MRHRIPRTWLVVVDGRHAKVWECRDTSGAIVPVPEMSLEAADQSSFSRSLKSDRPGRAFSSMGERRSAIEPKSDPHTFEKAVFARTIAEKLNEAFQKQAFRRLILIAPPAMLGHLRKMLPEAVTDTLVGEVAKELAHHDADEIFQRARPYLLNTATA